MIRELIISLILLVGNIALYFSLRLMDEPRSVIFPRVIISIMIILSGLLLIQGLVVRKKPSSAAGKAYPFGRIFFCFALIVIYFAFMEALGFYFSSFLFFVAVTYTLGRGDLSLKSGAVRVGISFVFMVVLYVLFNKLLLVQTPKGLLF